MESNDLHFFSKLSPFFSVQLYLNTESVVLGEFNIKCDKEFTKKYPDKLNFLCRSLLFIYDSKNFSQSIPDLSATLLCAPFISASCTIFNLS